MKWVIAFIDHKKRGTIARDFSKLQIEYEIGIPVIRILRKRFKNKQHFDTVPLMFNYGFIRLPRHILKSRERLMDIKDKVAGVYNWMYKKPGEDKFVVETVSEKKVKELLQRSEDLSIFSGSEMNRFKKGDFIILRGYPFEGLKAEIQYINHQTRRITVNIFIMSCTREVEVNYENVFYSVYENFDESVSATSLDEIESRYKNSFDRLQYKKSANGTD